MPNPSIDWTDGIGAATLTCLVPAFGNWTPDVNDIGETATAISLPAIHFFSYRTDNLLSFDVANISNTETALALRLKSHLVKGGSITINTEDADGTVYTAGLAPGTIPAFVMSDTTELEYTLSLVVAWTAVTTGP